LVGSKIKEGDLKMSMSLILLGCVEMGSVYPKNFKSFNKFQQGTLRPVRNKFIKIALKTLEV
jgi:hypothetical protein